MNFSDAIAFVAALKAVILIFFCTVVRANLTLDCRVLNTHGFRALRGRHVRQMHVTSASNGGRFYGTAAPRLVFRRYIGVARLILGTQTTEEDDEAQFVAARRLAGGSRLLGAG